MYRNYFKRIIDFIVALVALTVASPILLIIVVVLALANRGNPFFLQSRPGLHERLFKVIKFRTMNDKKDAAGVLLPDNARLTAAGAFLRRTSLDELPQLLNVLRGSMSLIGPRPLLIKYLPYYTPNERTRHDVRPGITGLAQVNGRNRLDWDSRLEMDAFYVKHLSFGMDAKILGKTMLGIVRATDVVVDPRSGMNDLDYERTSSR